MRGVRKRYLGYLAAMIGALCFAESARAELRVSPGSFVLDGPEASRQILVGIVQPGGAVKDVTRQADYSVADARILGVTDSGLAEARAEGMTDIVVRFGGEEARLRAEVRGIDNPAPVSFPGQIIPLLTKASCNSGGCHGKAQGQNGFKLSVFGFDPEADYRAIVMESRGRRVFPAAPRDSLLLAKATGRVAHGGGRRVVEGSLPYRRLLRWLTEGAQYQAKNVAPVVAIEVEPARQTLTPLGVQQLRVIAVDAAGKRHCVTADAEFDSNAPTIAAVDRRGGITAGALPGEAAILVRYLGQVTVCRIVIPKPGAHFARPAESNFIDRLVWNKLAELGVQPSAVADDATFLRRAFLDVIGTLPTDAEARAFLTDTDPRKRAKLIDRLLERPEYADYWAMVWSDLLRVDRDALTAAGSVAMTRWLHRQFAENRPYDEFVHAIITARGSTRAESPAGFYKVLGTPEVMSRSVSQLFLGVRIECAQCHHHPSEKWGQDDYFALAGFFTGVARKTLPTGAEAIVARGGQDLKQPRTGKIVPTHALAAPAPKFATETDRRQPLADWMTASANPYFARAIANRLWAHYFGRGLVEPIDDMRATNPATNEPLLDALASDLRKQHFDLKAFTRTLLNSRVYQLAAQTSDNAGDEQNFSHAATRALPAEVLLDAVNQATGVHEKFNGWPEGVRAIAMWDNRMPSYFLQLFGRPMRASVCSCERSQEPSIAQALHLMNGPEIMAKIQSRQGTARRLAASGQAPRAIVDELYLATLARFPAPREQAAMLKLFAGGSADRRAAIEDALWALLNTKEFVYNH